MVKSIYLTSSALSNAHGVCVVTGNNFDINHISDVSLHVEIYVGAQISGCVIVYAWKHVVARWRSFGMLSLCAVAKKFMLGRS